MSLAAAESKPAPGTRMAAVEPEESTLGRISRWMGLSGNEPKPEQAAPVPSPKRAPRPAAAAAVQPKPKPQQQAAAAEQPVPTTTPTANATATGGTSLMSGATPVVSGDSFETRFGPMR